MESKLEKLLLTPNEVSEMTGCCRSKTYALLASGTIPSIRIGKSVRVPVDSLKNWISNQLEQQTEATLQ